jgi:hypothetical protein
VAEERWRAEHFRYLDVSSTDTNWYPRDPTTESQRVQAAFHNPAHDDAALWRVLNPTVTGPVEFGYMVNAGLPSGSMTTPAETVAGLTWPAANEHDHWYVIQAKADMDGDGDVAYFLASSLKADVYRQNEGE